ncbi:uncharacterized protein LOC107789173 [Nicotiana tabacum]|uniref:Uncharacterized protein LOC107789173 n=1 Tax=Nicotiana tabacum TaxID=4097 RepID=A0AC58RX17_TOBAC
MAVESEATEYDSIFALMAQSDDDGDKDDDEVNFLDVQRNIKSYSPKKLMSLANMFFDAYHSLINDKDALNVELGESEQTRDDLVIVVVDLKETIENLKKENYALDEKNAHIEHDRDDLIVVVVDLKETFECVRKEKEVLVERVTNIEHERDDLLVVVVDLKETIGELKIESRPENSQKRKEVASEGTMKGSSLQWYMDSGCSKHMTESTNDFLSLKALQGGSVSFGNDKKGYILGVGRIGKSLSHTIENVYYVNGLKYSLLSVSQICDKGNKVEFVSKICTVTNLVTGEVVLVARRYKNIYVADFESLQNGDLNCLSAVDDDAELWHRRLGHTSFMLLNKLVRKDLVRGLPKTKDETFEVFVAFVKKIQVNMGNKVACISSDHRTEFDNAKFDEFCIENGEVIGMANGKADMISHVKESSEDDASTPPSIGEEPGPLITPTEAENRVVDAVQELKHIKEALKDADWITAIQEELHQFERNKEEGIDYDETFSPVARMEAIRILIAFAYHMEFTLFQMDVKSAFLNGYLKEEVYVKQPPGFQCYEHPEHVFKLDKALYGLKKAPRAWYEMLSKFLLENGFTRRKIDNILFMKKRGRNLLIIQQSQKRTMISQQKYIKELLKRFDMETSKVIDTLIATITRLDMDEPGSPVNQTRYRGIIGSLLYLTASRPDIVFSVGLVRFQSNPKESHLKSAKRILRYLKGMQDVVLYYPSCDRFDLIGYADADYAGYLADRKNTSRIAHFLGSCLIP